MLRCTALTLSLAMVAASTPVAAADPMGALLDKIQRAQDRGQFAAAAEMAAPASRRTDLSAANRYVLAGLAAGSYGDAFTHGGAPRQPGGEPRYLCEQRSILQEAAALASDAEEATIVSDALQGVAGQLAVVAASGRVVPCAIVSPGSQPTPGDDVLLAVPTRSTAANAIRGPGERLVAPAVTADGPAPPPSTALPRRRPTARVALGASLIVAGVGFASGLAVSLVARDRMNGVIASLDATATSQGRELTLQERAAATTADARFARFGHAGAAFGTLAGLTLLTAVVLLALPPKARVTSRVRPAAAGLHLTF